MKETETDHGFSKRDGICELDKSHHGGQNIYLMGVGSVKEVKEKDWGQQRQTSLECCCAGGREMGQQLEQKSG